MNARIYSIVAAIALTLSLGLLGCSSTSQQTSSASENATGDAVSSLSASDLTYSGSSSTSAASSASSSASSSSASAESSSSSEATEPSDSAEATEPSASAEVAESSSPESTPAPTGSADSLRASLNIAEDYRASFDHGEKGAEYQKYIVLHDTESESDASSVIGYWDGSGNGVAAHFVVNQDGSVWQCVPLDRITHHAGFGDTGHNDMYGITESDRDDKVGTTPIGDWASDYGMNSWSVGIEMVHTGGSGYYPEEQLEALDKLIAYIDAYYGFQSTIIDHKAWRSGNSDTSPEFAGYLANYQDHRTHN